MLLQPECGTCRHHLLELHVRFAGLEFVTNGESWSVSRYEMQDCARIAQGRRHGRHGTGSGSPRESDARTAQERRKVAHYGAVGCKIQPQCGRHHLLKLHFQFAGLEFTTSLRRAMGFDRQYVGECKIAQERRQDGGRNVMKDSRVLDVEPTSNRCNNGARWN